jgi:hypothetical protein
MLCTVNPGKDKIGGIKLLLDKIQLINGIYGGGFDKEPDAPSNSLEIATATEESTPTAQPQPLPTMTEKIYGEKPPSQPTPPAPTTPSFDLEIEGQEQAAKSNDMDDEIPF